MNIKVKGYLTYRDVIGQRIISQTNNDPVTLLEFIRELAAEVGGEHGRAIYDKEKDMIGGSVAIMLNGVHYNHLPDRLDTLMKDKDEIAIFPPAAGGSF